MKVISVFLLLLLLSSCLLYTVPTLGYFEVDAYSKPLTKKITTPIHLVLMEDVKDSLTVAGDGLKELEVVEFRKTFSDGMTGLLERNFETVLISDQKPEKGLSLVVYRVKPFWKTNSRLPSSYMIDGKTYYRTTSFSSVAFQYESSLFIDNEDLISADSTIYSNDEAQVVSQFHPVFKNGFISVCENINREIFKDHIIEKLQQP